jgi:hypothetical protein
VAVCLLAGTEIAFDENVRCNRAFGILPARKIDHRLARFRQIDMKTPGTHHDALEFPDGQVVLLTRLSEGQRATIVQLPAASRAAEVEREVVLLAFDLSTLSKATSSKTESRWHSGQLLGLHAG